MDGRRAAPVNNGVASVTVLATDCMSADAWATALLVAGPAEGMALAQRMRLEALFIVRREERWVACGALLYTLVLNALGLRSGLLKKKWL